MVRRYLDLCRMDFLFGADPAFYTWMCRIILSMVIIYAGDIIRRIRQSGSMPNLKEEIDRGLTFEEPVSRRGVRYIRYKKNMKRNKKGRIRCCFFFYKCTLSRLDVYLSDCELQDPEDPCRIQPVVVLISTRQRDPTKREDIIGGLVVPR